MQNYRDLLVWQEAIKLIELIYLKTKDYPKEESFSLTNQTRRSAVSVAANIGEGYGRSYRKEYLQHLSIARGSLYEIETHIIIANKIGYISNGIYDEIWSQIQIVAKLLNGLIRSLKA